MIVTLIILAMRRRRGAKTAWLPNVPDNKSPRDACIQANLVTQRGNVALTSLAEVAVPEPASMGVLGARLLTVGLVRRKRRR